MELKGSLKITVKDKDDAIGRIIIPVTEIPPDVHFLKWISLNETERKSPFSIAGEICLDYWLDVCTDEGKVGKINSKSQRRFSLFQNKFLTSTKAISEEQPVCEKLQNENQPSKQRRHTYAGFPSKMESQTSNIHERDSHTIKNDILKTDGTTDPSLKTAKRKYTYPCLFPAKDALPQMPELKEDLDLLKASNDPIAATVTERETLNDPVTEGSTVNDPVTKRGTLIGPVRERIGVDTESTNLEASKNDVSNHFVTDCDCSSFPKNFTRTKFVNSSKSVEPIPNTDGETEPEFIRFSLRNRKHVRGETFFNY